MTLFSGAVLEQKYVIPAVVKRFAACKSSELVRVERRQKKIENKTRSVVGTDFQRPAVAELFHRLDVYKRQK